MSAPALRLLFASWHAYLDPSSGAALCTRDLLEGLAERGWDCAAVCGPQLDFERPRPIPDVLREHRLAYRVERCALPDGRRYDLYHYTPGRVPVAQYQQETFAPHRPPAQAEGVPFLDVFARACERFCPDVVLTYGGPPIGPHLIRRARRRGAKVAFALHNFAYTEADLFREVDAILVPSRTAQEHYRGTLGIESTAIPGPWDWGRFRCPEIDGRFVTFVNPQPDKGVFVFARIAAELARRRPDIPLLVVEGRGGAEWLGRTGLDLAGLPNLQRMPNTADPRRFYRLSKLVLMPSLWRESFSRVAVEATANRIPVLAGRRGGLPETLAEAGLLLDLPERLTPESREAPSAEEVAAWLGAIERLWDDSAAFAAEQARCERAARAWHPEVLLPRFEQFFRHVAGMAHGNN